MGSQAGLGRQFMCSSLFIITNKFWTKLDIVGVTQTAIGKSAEKVCQKLCQKVADVSFQSVCLVPVKCKSFKTILLPSTNLINPGIPFKTNSVHSMHE